MNSVWIEAINSGGAKEYKQRPPCIFAKIIQSQGYSPSDTLSSPNFEAIYLPCDANFVKNRTYISHKLIIKNLSQE